MAASSPADARGVPPAERYRLLRELGARAVPTRAAIDTQVEGRNKVVVVERVERGGTHGDQEIADWVRDARRLATLDHPNVVRVRDVVIRGEDVLVVNDFIDGVRWSELVETKPRPALEVALRIFVDVLSGLSAIHNLRDAKREPLKLVHGELTPDCVIVGLDGIGRLASTCRLHSATARPGRDGSAYLAPEVLLADESTGPKADVYSVGVMLWEALSGRALFPNTQPSAIVTHLLSGKVAKPVIPEGVPWAAPLADIVAGALAADPEKRFASAAALAAELRKVAGPKLAPPTKVAGLVRGTHGDAIRARREALERGEEPKAREVSGVEPPPDSEVVADSIKPEPIPSTAPTPLPPQPGVAALEIPPEAVKPPPLPSIRGRLPTLSGVAPPKEVAAAEPAAGTRVVVAPPTPMVAFEVPGKAMPSSSEITVAPRQRALPPPLPAASPEPVAVVPPAPPIPSPPRPAVSVQREDVQPSPRRRRAVLLALVAGSLTFAIVVLAWWSASRTAENADTSAARASATATATVDTPAAATSTTATAAIAAPSAAVVLAPLEEKAAATSTAPPVAAVATRPPPAWTPPPPAAQAT
ncbi:MAG TPA: protein kinase, partial [Polyangiaceae bacterium]